MQKKVFKVEGMDCDSCAKMIELDLEDAGVVARCSFAKKTLEIDENNGITKEEIQKILDKDGYRIST